MASRTPLPLLLRSYRPTLQPLSSASSALRHYSSSYSSSSSRPTFVPFSRTSADTEIPYGEPTQPSSVYLPMNPQASASTATSDTTEAAAAAAATTTPSNLTDHQRRVLDKILRVDQAGELGANWIYRGQHAVLKRNNDPRIAALIQDMWDGEKKHIATFDKLITQHGVRPTALYPVWKAAGFALGSGTALLGNRAAMACTEAVETVIGEHYNSQLKELDQAFPSDHPSIPLLKRLLLEFRDDELAHLDTAVENESQQAPAYALLSAAIATGCRLAIGISGKV